MKREPESKRSWTGLGLMAWELANDQADWSQETFGLDTERGSIGPLKHLEKECRETIEAVEIYENAVKSNGDILGSGKALRMEFADCLLLLLDAARRSGVDVYSLFQAATEKMVINKARTWPKPTDNNPVEHVRDGE